MNDASGVTWLAQALGITAFAISLVGYLSPCDRHLKIMMTVGTALLSLQFVLFGGLCFGNFRGTEGISCTLQ